MLGTGMLLTASAINIAVAVKNLTSEDVQQHIEAKKVEKKREEERKKREEEHKKREEARKRMELRAGENLIAQGEVELKKLNIERLGFKLDTTALTCTDAITYFIHDIKTGKKRWLMLSQIKDMIENNQRIQ